MTTDTYELEVCTDCAMLIANGEVPEDQPDFDLLEEWNDWHLALDCDEDGCEGFSWSRCDGCGSPLGGSRHDAVAWKVEVRCTCFRCDGYGLTSCLNGKDEQEHDFQRSRFTETLTCTKCGLLPLDYDDRQTACEVSA